MSAELGTYTAILAPMLVLVCLSAFFSGSEAALFFLDRRDREAFARGTRSQRTAAQLLRDPESLLSAVLFWNLLINLAYFTLASVTSTRLSGAAGGAFSLGSLLALIVVGELVPKNLAVLNTRRLAAQVALPVAAAVRVVRPVLPLLRTVNLLSRRLLWPGFAAEPYLEIADLERAIHLAADEAHRQLEHTVLQNIVELSDLRADEVMRPRAHLRTFRPPVHLTSLQGRPPQSGYLLITEPDSDELAAAVPLRRLAALPDEHLERLAEDVVYVPWSTSVAAVLETLLRRGRLVAVVVNELGETIGVITLDDILQLTFGEAGVPLHRTLHRSAIMEVAPGVWHATGMTNLRRLARVVGRPFPETHSVTLSGVLQEALGRIPQPGDTGQWGELNFRVLDSPQQGPLLAELTLAPSTAEDRA